ncbi:MAG: peptidyl-prolyl cis-trans isomerase [Candidatus Babeliales bacterium]|nr:peptidyl-prolyl cis-trans isomerase [Candidatus Babeliales bacterium]
MISDMRSKFKKSGFQVLIWVVLLSMVGAASLPELLKKLWGEPTEWSISVNGTKASIARYQQKIEEQKQFIAMLKKQFGAYADMLLSSYGLNNDPKELATKTLIQELLLGNVASKLKIKVDPEYAHQEILKQLPPEMLSAGSVDMASLSRMLNYSSVEEFKKEIENNIKNKMILDFTKAAAYVPEFVVINQYNKADVKKRYSILVFPFDKYLANAKKTALTDKEVATFYAANKKNYMTTEKREGLVWEFNPETYGINVTDKEIESYYNKNKKLYVDKPVQIQVKRILFKVADPKDMATVRPQAQKALEELKKDPTKFSGEVIEFSKGQKDAELERAAFELEANGDISGLVQTKEGLEIIQRIGKKPATFKKLEDVKNLIKEVIRKERFKKLFDLDAKQFIRKVNADTTDKAALINNFKDQKKATEKKLGLTAVSQAQEVQKLYSIRTEQGFVYYTQGDKGYIVELTKIDKSYLPEISAIKKDIENDIYSQKAEAKLKSDLEKAKQDNKSLEELKALFDAKLINTGWISQAENSDEAMLKKEKIPAPALFNLEKEGAATSLIEDNNGYLIKVDSVEPFNMHKFEEQRKATEDSLQKQNIAEIESGFIASLQKNAKIDINDKMLNQQQTKFPR